ncbi:MAG: contractile injection system protein, VgrG/Pvc8 family [Pseudomonadota bacterium]
MTRKAIYQVIADGVDFTLAAQARLLNLTVTDAAGVESDTVSIEIADPGGRTEPPRTGAIISVAMGWEDTGLVHMGKYVADTPTARGFPETLSVTGRAADQRETLKQHRTQGWENMTIGAIAEEIAGRNNLIPAVSGELASQLVPFIAQNEESDQHFFRRLVERYGGISPVKEGRLVAVPRGAGLSANGKALPAVLVRRGPQLLGYNVTLPDRPRFQRVKASWTDRANAKRQEVEAQAANEGPDFVLRDPYPTEPEAQAAADAKAAELKRGGGSLSLTLLGDPTIRAEQPLIVSGLRPGADGQWSIGRVNQSQDGNGGFTTKIQADKGEEEKA